MDLDSANELLKGLLFPNGKFDPKGYAKLAELETQAERQAADQVLQAETRSPEDYIRLSTKTMAAEEPFIEKSVARQLDVADKTGQYGTRDYKGRVDAVTDAKARLLDMGIGQLDRQQQGDSADYRYYTDKKFDARDKDRALMQRGQTMNLIKNLLGGAAILFN